MPTLTTLPILISFDIDGTLEVGEPQGSITMDFVRAVSHRGCIVGSCSDRPISFQKRLWSQHDIAVDFTALKQNLDEVKSRFAAAAYIHIGDTEVDEYFAIQSGFRFIEVDTMEWREWSVRVLQMESER